MNTGRLSKKTCLVTGASRGLGWSVARRFWSEGASLVLAVRDPDSVAALLTDLDHTTGQSAVIVPMDLFDAESVCSLVPRTLARGVEKIDVLVNNAGQVGPIGKVWDTPAEEWTSTISANLVAPAMICRAVVPWMAKFAAGKIITLSGGGATGPRQNFSAYAAAKAGLVRFSETLADEVKDLGITVNCVAPGPMGTAMLAAVEQAGPQKVGENEYAAAKKALAGGDDTMRAAVELMTFLASDRSDGVTGKLISAVWDNWQDFPEHLAELGGSDIFTLRRIAGRDRALKWPDK
jgi:NAD(P)-dependent dehydrogenase (short-subunit alcohol dehydrogenase family)